MDNQTKRGTVVGKPAPDFTLQDHNRAYVNLMDSIKVSSAMLAFYPENFSAVCTDQLCDYRDNIEQFVELGVQIFGISKNDASSHSKFIDEYQFPFSLLCDPNNSVARQYGCTSLLMLGNVSRAVFLVNTKGTILYRYVEPTTFTRRKSHELIGVINQLRKNNLF